MGTDSYADETTVGDRGSVPVPAEIRDRFDIQPGDKIRWRLTDDGDIELEVVNQRFGAFEGFEPIDIGETNAADEHNLSGAQ
ncbi:AbrB/MazE/SpoVT family DNA-binding domain-containing protein [Natronobiforma cellulositropha]|uniref:AbrB/MazE/SpoVT family DNA-binding domain-containing protein n=1 Tax=Natronobiforma cellulositropha TaxID=1679076 RepID=UPI0021D58B8F|nr:AbrB/MazE/SpoVT family DNA-binding domain-containing protein [Natronobiforma cellulositropha]